MEIKAITLPPTTPDKGRAGGDSVVVPPTETRQTDKNPARSTESPVQTETVAESAASEQPLNEAVTHLNEYMQNHRRNLEFSVDEGSGRTVIKVIDAETDEVIREIPPEEVMKTAQFLRERAEGSEGAILRVQA